ncbi:precorrin-3B C(17)-methyltransferase [Desulfolucanica intricata]|uniref:precorrin-3B C(17)-methyltransferase n=1 Tax=Desulfolucanica intricata TaxID=1285191 RepID=UPI0009ED848A|nr:precorrin-3B C(17)-methyltransferase [Desulfolucanica intricata]
MVGLGPGSSEYMSLRARKAIAEAEIIVGYKTYVDLIADLIDRQEVLSTGMTKEIERCAMAIERAAGGKNVAVVSSGDPGVYGMAGLILELLYRDDSYQKVEVEIIPGITSATAAAACLGAPLMHDFTVISLSDLLTPWELIEKRLHAAGSGDFVVVLYNPASRRRTEHIKIARQILLNYKSPQTPVGIVRNADRKGQDIILTNLEHMLEHPIDMFTTVIIGNKTTTSIGGYMVTPRGYSI